MSRTETTIGDIVFSRAAYDGFPAGAMSVTGGPGKVTVTLKPSILPEGWTIDSAFAAAFEQEDDETEPMMTVRVGCKTSAPYRFDIPGLAGGKTYVVSAWFQLTKPDGAKAYGQAQTMTAAAI